MEARTSHGPGKTQGQRGVEGQGGGWHAGGVCPALKAAFFFFLFLSLNADPGHTSVVDTTGIWPSAPLTSFSPLQI